MERIHTLARQTSSLNIVGNAPTTRGGGGRGVGGGTVGATRSIHPAQTLRNRTPSNVHYRAFGPSMIDSGGGMGINMLKGMGIAYGIAGLGSLIGSAVKESTEYDNLMQTAKNILGTHDKLPDFEGRYSMLICNYF